MEKVITTITGYEGLERYKLIRLIKHTQAYYIGKMRKANTHLVCFKFEGAKYNLAKKFNTIIVNHQWVEECFRQGKRVPEGPYMLKSGEEVGPLTIEPPEGFPKRVYKTCRMYDKYFTEDGELIRSGSTPELSTWTDDSFLLEELDTEENRLAVGLPLTKPQNDVSDDNEPDSGRQETEAVEKVSAQVSCFICMNEISSSRGILLNGLSFCYSCIQTLADRLVSETKKTTCPLCKSSFITNTKIENDKRYGITYQRRRNKIGEAAS